MARHAVGDAVTQLRDYFRVLRAASNRLSAMLATANLQPETEHQQPPAATQSNLEEGMPERNRENQRTAQALCELEQQRKHGASLKESMMKRPPAVRSRPLNPYYGGPGYTARYKAMLREPGNEKKNQEFKARRVQQSTRRKARQKLQQQPEGLSRDLESQQQQGQPEEEQQQIVEQIGNVEAQIRNLKVQQEQEIQELDRQRQQERQQQERQRQRQQER